MALKVNRLEINLINGKCAIEVDSYSSLVVVEIFNIENELNNNMFTDI